MALSPWHKLVDPREDLRDGQPTDAAEFAVHLDHVREGRAPLVYQDPAEFFQRTYLTKNLSGLAVEVLRRLSGILTETSPVFNLATQFGGGKTHALTLLYHLAQHGPQAPAWAGVPDLIQRAGVKSVPKAAVAVLVGTELDLLEGRGGRDGEPLRLTPWGEIAWQLGGAEAFAVVAEHDQRRIAPGGDVIRRFLPQEQPCLILVDELMNYISRSRELHMDQENQIYDFLQNLSETVRGQANAVLAVSIPASELEMTPQNQMEHDRIKKLLDRLGKAVVMSSEEETSEIIRRRLFEWHGVPPEAQKVASAFAEWISDHRQQVPAWFPVDRARETFLATYPFHPTVLSVFERKWQALPRFQRTRGVLRLLALWVSQAYRDGYQGGHRDLLIGLGTAPLDNQVFRTALFEQLGEDRLEGAVTTDICGKKDAHAVRLDAEAVNGIKKARLHRKVATTIFFESNGGQSRDVATLPEIRLGVAEPGLDIGNLDTVLDALNSSCYFLNVEGTKYRFGVSPNLNKLLADRRANPQIAKNLDECVQAEVQKVFSAGPRVDRVFFPGKSSDVPDRPALTLVIMPPELPLRERGTTALLETMTREHGASGRTFKNALVWCVADDSSTLTEEARNLLAWEDLKEEQDELGLDAIQRRQLAENLEKSRRNLRESVWRTYKNLLLLGQDNQLRVVDLGLVHSSQNESLTGLIISRLTQEDALVESVSPTYLVRNWPGQVEWTTKAVRDAFFASPKFPRLANPNAIKETIAKGVTNGIMAYAGQASGGRYEPFYFNQPLAAELVEISEDACILTAEEARKFVEPPTLKELKVTPADLCVKPGESRSLKVNGFDQHGRLVDTGQIKWSSTGGSITLQGAFTAGKQIGSYSITASTNDLSAIVPVEIRNETVAPLFSQGLSWTGEVPPQKWTNFYTKVVSRFAANHGLKLTVSLHVDPRAGVSSSEKEETRLALRELGLDDQSLE